MTVLSSYQKFYNFFVILFIMRKAAVPAYLYPLSVLFDIAFNSRTVIISVQGTVTEQAVQPFPLRHFMTGIVFTVSVFEVFI